MSRTCGHILRMGAGEAGLSKIHGLCICRPGFLVTKDSVHTYNKHERCSA